MNGLFKDAVKHRRTYYSITNTSPVSDKEIQDMLEFAVLNVPSAFNSQTARVVLLLGENHLKLWDIVMRTLKKMVPPEAFGPTENKVNSFAAGYGTILFFEEQQIVGDMQKQFPLYAEKFPQWSEHTSAMHQYTIWTMLESVGFGASLQHYNPIIDDEVKQAWNLPTSWRLIAQMPFGTPTAEPAEKVFKPLTDRLLVFK